MVATAFHDRASGGSGHTWSKRISTHLASALVVFCLLQIFVVAKLGGSLLMHIGIIVAIGGFGVAARVLERRWEWRERGDLSQESLRHRFRVDVAQLWIAVIVGALMWIPVGIISHALFG